MHPPISLRWQHCRIRKRLSSSAAEGGAPAWWVELELADNPRINNIQSAITMLLKFTNS